MSVTVHLSGHLKPFSDGQVEINLAGEFVTVGEALDALWKENIALRDRILNEQGEIRQHVNIFVGSEDLRRLKGFQTVIKTNDLYIFNAVSGG